MSRPILYSLDVSPPCRSVLLTAKAIGLELEIKEINLANGDHLTEEYLKINPQHTIPALNDNGFILTDSHAICTYLVDKYAKNDCIYPKDLQKRAIVNQRLYFDAETLFSNLKATFKPIIFDEIKVVPEERKKNFETAFQLLEKFLDNKKWLAGDSYTLADIVCVTTVSGINIVAPIDKYPKIAEWYKRCAKEIPGFAAVNEKATEQLAAMVKSKLS